MPHANPAAAVAPRRPVKRLIATIFVVALCFCAICGKVLLDARRAAWEQAAQVATSLVATLQSDILRTIESYDLSLRGVVDNLAYPEVTTISPALRQLVLFDRSATAKHLQSIVLLDENGIVRLDSRMPFAKPVDRSKRSYFQFHKNNEHFQLHISEPIRTRESRTRVIVVSRRLSNPDGSFAGVVAGSVRLAYFQQLFKDASLGPNSNITLSHTDGTLLMRWPYQDAMLGRNLKSGELYKRLAVARSGQFEAPSITDGVDRLTVYSQVGDLPLVIGVGQSSADIYAQWRGYASMIGLLILLLCAMSVALALYLAREMGRRNAAEASLAVLATMDDLTGLSNRRYLSEAFDREWRRAMRDRTSLALVMCDADLFKSYNDRHGHQAGDKLLQAIGMAMNQSIQRSTDVAARYGGDEFAILLPAASADGGARIADEIRSRLPGLCDGLGIAHSPLSIGVAALVPEPGEDQALLMSAADKALYRAKDLGRDRIVVAEKRTPKPVLVVRNDAA
jgi:diguanylate cyclase (GGDEF)-like protein